MHVQSAPPALPLASNASSVVLTVVSAVFLIPGTMSEWSGITEQVSIKFAQLTDVERRDVYVTATAASVLITVDIVVQLGSENNVLADVAEKFESTLTLGLFLDTGIEGIIERPLLLSKRLHVNGTFTRVEQPPQSASTGGHLAFKIILGITAPCALLLLWRNLFEFKHLIYKTKMREVMDVPKT
jgi:hypothetical protein